MTRIGLAPGAAMVAQDISDLQRWPGHAAPGRSVGHHLQLQVKMLKRADHFAQYPIGNVGIGLGGGEFLVSEQHLDEADIDLMLKQVCGVGMPQTMKGNGLIDVRELQRIMKRPVELPGGEMVDRVSPWKQPAVREYLMVRQCVAVPGA